MKAEEFNAKNIVPPLNADTVLALSGVYTFADQVARATALQCAALTCTACSPNDKYEPAEFVVCAAIPRSWRHKRKDGMLTIPCRAAAIHALIAKDYK